MEVCLNREPVFEEDDELVDEKRHDNEVCETMSNREPQPPTVGLEFDSFDKAYDFYNKYGREQGFGIRVSNSWFRSKMKERYRAKLSCSSAGFKKKSESSNPRPETRTGCPAMIIIKLVDSKRWKIIEVELLHNHPVSPEIKRFYKSHKRMILASKKGYQLEPVKEIHTIKLYHTNITAVDHADSNLNGKEVRFPIKKSSNHLDLKGGDVLAVYNYLCRMKLTNPNFFYLMDLNDEGRLKNVFWADARSKVAYNYFYDTILIDTTSLAYKYEIPIVSFVGVNHHRQYVLLGCAFLGDDSLESFTWMFKTWLTCMMDRPPRVIISERSKPLQAAVHRVFPRSRHCYCLCYIMQQLPEKLGGLEAIKRQIHKAVYESLKIVEFETSWYKMINDHDGLGGNKWLQALYEDRQQWVPVYLKDVAFSGMIPMKVNETLDAFFGGYVHKHTSFKEFLDKYDLALHRNRLKEAMEDLESRKASIFTPKTRCSFETQLSRFYTKQIFKLFQAEVEGMQSCFNTRQVSVNGPITTYLVKERVQLEGGEEKEIRTLEVVYESTRAEIRCICGLFNFNGYLCRHALSVLNYNGIEEVPSQYILPRWSRDYKVRSELAEYRLDDLNNGPLYWYNHLSQRALRIVEEGAKSKEHYNVVEKELGELFDKLSLLDDSV